MHIRVSTETCIFKYLSVRWCFPLRWRHRTYQWSFKVNKYYSTLDNCGSLFGNPVLWDRTGSQKISKLIIFLSRRHRETILFEFAIILWTPWIAHPWLRENSHRDKRKSELDWGETNIATSLCHSILLYLLYLLCLKSAYYIEHICIFQYIHFKHTFQIKRTYICCSNPTKFLNYRVNKRFDDLKNSYVNIQFWFLFFYYRQF